MGCLKWDPRTQNVCFGTLLGSQPIKYLVQYHKVRLQSYGYHDMKSLASISLSISTVYLEKKPIYFFRASAKVKFNVLYTIYILNFFYALALKKYLTLYSLRVLQFIEDSFFI